MRRRQGGQKVVRHQIDLRREWETTVPIKIGDRLPDATLKHMTEDGIADVHLTEFLAGKQVILFGLPGAFTPVCTTQHLPGFISESSRLKGEGIDEIVCIAVNDPFVLDAWGDSHGALGKVLLFSDYTAAFTRSIGLSADLTQFGCGERSQRYSMVVADGVVTELHVEESMFDHQESAAARLLAAPV